MTKPITGYAEGFYGRLLSWAERRQILDTLQRLGFTSYYYAPKEDPCRRLHWRTPYSLPWRQDFQAFCKQARQQGIQVVAGVAPGLDFDFSHLPDGQDFHSLVAKCRWLLEDGADIISLLMDDIDADFDKRRGEFAQEGQAHAALANALGDALSADQQAYTLWVTPRIYADELIDTAQDAIEHCLWRWKTPLSREWYNAIFGLKHDLLTLAGEHSPLRIRKTQNAPLADVLQQQSR